MKKILIAVSILIIILFCNYQNNNYVIIPEESIRFRIIPNSNSIEDLYIKEEVKKSLEENILSISDATTLEEERTLIQDNIPLIKQNISNVFLENDYNETYSVNFGLNYFPEKEYAGVKYNEGYYESLVVEIGEAKGDNFWCVLFPPLCLLERESNEDVEYSSIVLELINKYFK